MDKERIIAKIKKCLDMAQHAGSNPAEAETALRQAHKLMAAYNLEMGDVLASEVGETRIAAGAKKAPAWRLRLAIACAEAFGGTAFVVIRSFGTSGRIQLFNFIGCGVSHELMAYAYAVLERQLQKARRDHLKTLGGMDLFDKRAHGTAFAHGWLDAVYSKIADFAGSDPAGANAIKAFIGKRYPNAQDKNIRQTFYASALDSVQAGYAVGLSAQLHQAVNRQPVAQLSGSRTT